MKKITDKTIQDLLQNEVILPSVYFKSFDQNAKELSVNITDEHFENEVNTVIADELKNINAYMRETLKNIELLATATEGAQKAINDKDTCELDTLSKRLVKMKGEMQALKDSIYIDSLTKTFNKKWIYNHALSAQGTFEESGLLLLIDVNDSQYLANKYGDLIADNVIIYIAKFLTLKFEHEKIDFNIAKFSHDQFVLFIKESTLENISSLITNISLEFANTTLKSKSGLMFKTNFDFALTQYSSGESFQTVFAKSCAQSIDNKQQ